jgi:hypothetical protein
MPGNLYMASITNDYGNATGNLRALMFTPIGCPWLTAFTTFSIKFLRYLFFNHITILRFGGLFHPFIEEIILSRPEPTLAGERRRRKNQ